MKVSSSMPSWLSRVVSHNMILNVFSDYISLPCYVVSPEDYDTWYVLAQEPQVPFSYQFELYFGKGEARLQYNQRCFEEAARTKQPVLGQHAGLWDFFVPILQSGRCVAFLVSGSFLKAIPAMEDLIEQFKALAGKSPGLSDSVFVGYGRAVLESTLLGGPVLREYERLLQLIARMIGGEEELSVIIDEIGRLKTKVFSKKLPTRMWRYAAIKRDRLLWGPWQGTDLSPWDREEFQLTRHPNIVLAVMLHQESRSSQVEIESLIQTVEMQWASFQFVHQLPETICGKMGDEGVFFMTSIDPKKNSAQAKLQVRDIAFSIEAFLKKRFKAPVFIGVSRLNHPAGDLPEAFRESVLALHLGLHHQNAILFYQDQFSARSSAGEFIVYEWAKKLVEACGRAAEKEIYLAREQYVKEVLRASGERPENLRIYFLQLLYQLLEIVRKRSLVVDPQASDLGRELSDKYNIAHSTAELLAVFRTHLEFLSGFFKSPLRGERSLRLERAKEYIAQNFQRPISLKEVASQAGFSISRFSRHFKQTYGIGFSDFVFRLRFDHARRLLETSRLSIGQISQDCGFQFTSHFIQQFKRKAKVTPQAYRLQKGRSSLNQKADL